MPINLDALTMRRHAPHLVAEINAHPSWRFGAEIGVAAGRTLLGIMRNCPRVHMLAVDAFEYVGDSENSGLYKDLPHAVNEKSVKAVHTAFPDRITVMKGLTHEVATVVPDRTLDFVFIDASHIYLDVRRDIMVWGPKVRDDGFILGHDYCKRWPGVRRAVDELLGPPMQLPETIWMHRKEALFNPTRSGS